MNLEQNINEVAKYIPENVEDLRKHIDPEWIEQALQATGTASIRHRRLPAEQVVWLVIGMALFRNRSITEVVGKLNLALPGKSITVARSAIPKARARLGKEPMEWLFSRCADAWAHSSADAHRFRGLALYGVDGSTLRTADSLENRAHFGGSTGQRGASGYPLLRMVGLMALRSHLLASVAFGPYKPGELTYAAELFPSIPNQSLTLLDRGFVSAPLLYSLSQTGENRHFLVRGKKNLRCNVLKQFSKTDLLVEMNVSSHAKKQDPSLPKTWTVRVITYQRKGYRPQTLLTSLLDPVAYPAREIAELYHERWELELGYDEIKTEMLEREESLRSQSKDGVSQELFGILLAYNLVRLEMERIANKAGVLPTQISFVGALRLMTDEWLWCAIASPGAIPRHLRNLADALVGLLLPPRRKQRTYPRAVKIKMSGYDRNRPSPSKGALK